VLVLITFFSIAALSTPAAQAGAEKYERRGVTDANLPVFYENLKKDSSFRMSQSKVGGDFSQWRKAARTKFAELLLQEKDETDFASKIVDEQDRGSYVARKVVFNVSRYSRVLALVLIPKGDGLHPAALVLHDHGGKFEIGKEKLVEPWGDFTNNGYESQQALAANLFNLASSGPVS
jgi:hypothetical protein